MKVMVQVRNIAELERGDIIRNVGSGESYVVSDAAGRTATAVRTINISNAPEWLVMREVAQ